MKLKEGVYENLVSQQTEVDMRETEAAGLVCQTSNIDNAESAKMLADFLVQSIMKKLDEKEFSIEDKIKMVNEVLKKAHLTDEANIVAPQLLSAVITKQQQVVLNATSAELVRPKSLCVSSNIKQQYRAV